MTDYSTVIIVGAGAAGLGAARWLLDNDVNGKLTVIVLEGRDRVGGRIHTTMDFENVAIDLGACWIHEHGENNPISMMAKALNLEIRNADWDSINLLDLRGEKYSIFQKLFGLRNFHSLFYGSAKKSYDNDDYSQSFEDYIKCRAGQSQWENPLFQAVLGAYDFELGTSVRNVSPAAVDEEWQYAEHCGTRGFNMEILDTGFQGILDGLISGAATTSPAMRGEHCVSSAPSRRMDIRLGHTLRSVSLMREQDEVGGVVVTVSSRGNQGKEELNTMTADAVIVTVPLGVLKAGAIEFNPPLSSDKQDAIARAGFGNVVKVVMEFSEVFWAQSHEFIVIADPSLCLPFEEDSTASQQRGLFTLFWNFHLVSGRNILISFGLGDAADAIDLVH